MSGSVRRLRVVGCRIAPNRLADFVRDLGSDLLLVEPAGSEEEWRIVPTMPPLQTDGRRGGQPSAIPCASPLVSVILGSDETALAQALAANAAAIVEPGTYPALAANELGSGLDSGDLFLSFSTRTGYRVNVAALLVDHLRQRTDGSEKWCEGIRLALSEAIGNALLHGNLALESNKDPSADSFARHAERVANRLEDSQYGLRRVDLAISWPSTTSRLSVTVTDHGSGYEPEVTETAPNPSQPSGRGLRLIQDHCVRCDITRGGRSITMEFAS